MSRDMTWFVGRTQPQRERWASENCLRQGAEAYLPMIIERNVVVRGRLLKSRLKPLFPGYLFIRTTGQWRFLLGTFGLIDLIMSGENPAALPQVVIDDLKRREEDGAIELPSVQTTRLFADKDRVRISDGPFEGKSGIVAGYTDAERVSVLLDLLGRKVSVLFAEGQLEAA